MKIRRLFFFTVFALSIVLNTSCEKTAKDVNVVTDGPNNTTSLIVGNWLLKEVIVDGDVNNSTTFDSDDGRLLRFVNKKMAEMNLSSNIVKCIREYTLGNNQLKLAESAEGTCLNVDFDVKTLDDTQLIMDFGSTQVRTFVFIRVSDSTYRNIMNANSIPIPAL